MENEQKWVSISDAAKLLNVCETTVRRRIKKSELKAELKDTPFGKQYFIDKDQINNALNIIDVVKVKQEHSIQDLSFALLSYFDKRDAEFNETVDSLKNTINSLENKNAELVEKIGELTERLNSQRLDEVHTKLDALLAEKHKKSFWKFW